MNHMKKKPFIVFEGPDMCGKTTQLNLLKYNLEKKGLKVKVIKFPNYNGYYGDEIHKYISENNTFNLVSDEMLEKAKRHELKLTYNILAEFYELENYTDCDVILADRFDVSHLMYGLAMAAYIYRKRDREEVSFFNKKFKREMIHFLETQLETTKAIHTVYTTLFDVKYFRFEKSIILENISKKGREVIDAYDLNDSYQSSIEKLYRHGILKVCLTLLDYIYKKPYDKTVYIDRVNSYLNEIQENTLRHIDFDTLSVSNNENEISKISSVIEDSIFQATNSYIGVDNHD